MITIDSFLNLPDIIMVYLQKIAIKISMFEIGLIVSRFNNKLIILMMVSFIF